MRAPWAPVLAVAVVGAGANLSGCANSDPTAAPGAFDPDTIVVGTANFPESEIIGQLWARVLRDAGFKVEMSSQIGAREVYLGALESGDIDIVPEYTGNLAQYYDADVPENADADEVYAALIAGLPEGLTAGEKSPAESKDAYRVTRKTAEEEGIRSLADLGKLDRVRVAGNPELAERPFGPAGLEATYDLPADSVELKPISDGGGPLTISSLAEGEVDIADIYTTSPVFDRSENEVDVVTLEDPKNLILSQNLTPIYRADELPAGAIEALDDFNAGLTTDDLKQMNVRNVGEEKAEPEIIADDFLHD